eukprot:m.251789 g.251789  ORF g.251789 m.251789 type:complete len:76 (+) comp19545_c0_seq5:1148-1375(+)
MHVDKDGPSTIGPTPASIVHSAGTIASSWDLQFQVHKHGTAAVLDNNFKLTHSVKLHETQTTLCRIFTSEISNSS